jgi:hypothetical protein
MTEEERDELTDALDRAVKARLRLRLSGGDERSFDLTCPVCGRILTVPARPWDPVLAARRLDVFTLLHHDHADRDGTVEEEW